MRFPEDTRLQLDLGGLLTILATCRAKAHCEVDHALGGEWLLELVALLPFEYAEGDDALTDLVVR